MNVYLDIEFSLSNTALVVHRSLNTTFVNFIGVLLGSVFGIMGTIGGLMSISEPFSDKIKSKIEKNKNMRIRLENIERMRILSKSERNEKKENFEMINTVIESNMDI